MSEEARSAALIRLAQPIRVTVTHRQRGTSHGFLITHSDEDGEVFKGSFIGGIYKGATEIITSELLIG